MLTWEARNIFQIFDSIALTQSLTIRIYYVYMYAYFWLEFKWFSTGVCWHIYPFFFQKGHALTTKHIQTNSLVSSPYVLILKVDVKYSIYLLYVFLYLICKIKMVFPYFRNWWTWSGRKGYSLILSRTQVSWCKKKIQNSYTS